MSKSFVFLIGLLIGWLLEWIIDWVYWRMKSSSYRFDSFSQKNTIVSLKSEITEKTERLNRAEKEQDSLRKTIDRLEKDAEELRAEKLEPPDNLEKIKGVGPVIAGKLNAAGIFSFEKLAQLSPEELEGILGTTRRSVDEENLIAQARQFAEE